LITPMEGDGGLSRGATHRTILGLGKRGKEEVSTCKTQVSQLQGDPGGGGKGEVVGSINEH